VFERVFEEVREHESEDAGVGFEFESVREVHVDATRRVLLAELLGEGRHERAELDALAVAGPVHRSLELPGLVAEFGQLTPRLDDGLGMGLDFPGVVGVTNDLCVPGNRRHVVAEVVPQDAIENFEALFAALLVGHVLTDERVADVGVGRVLDWRTRDAVLAALALRADGDELLVGRHVDVRLHEVV